MKNTIRFYKFMYSICLVLSITIFTIIFILFFMNIINIYLLLCLSATTYLTFFLKKQLNTYYFYAYKSLISGDKAKIDELSTNTLNLIKKKYIFVDNQIVINSARPYQIEKKQHPTFAQIKQAPNMLLPIDIAFQYQSANKKLLSENLIINKEIVFSTGSKLYKMFIVDDINKRFAIIEGSNITIKAFSDLLSSEIYNSSNNVQIGTQGYRTDIHTSLVINLKPNLQTPNITINFLNLHERPFPNSAYDIKGALDYIIEYNNNNPS